MENNTTIKSQSEPIIGKASQHFSAESFKGCIYFSDLTQNFYDHNGDQWKEVLSL